MKKYVIYLFALLLITACSESENVVEEGNQQTEDEMPDEQGDGGDESTGWLLPISEIVDGGPGKDGIPSVDKPIFISASEQDFLSDQDLVVGMIHNGVARAYPHLVLDWHEIVNDELQGKFITINYCPLTGTAYAWSGIVGGEKSTFGVSGLLYNANLILYDRVTDSHWSQIQGRCVNGDLIGDKPGLVDIVETNWKTWKTMYPGTHVLSTDTGFNRPYETYPYGSYKVDNDFFIFTPSILNNNLPYKERVYTVVSEGKAKAYQFGKFGDGKAFIDEFLDKNYLVVGNRDIIKAYLLPQDLLELDFEFYLDSSGTLFKDTEGNIWSLDGEAISGPRTGRRLAPAESVTSFWFAVAAFYPTPAIYTNE